MLIDHNDTTYHGRPVWCVYGVECAPQIVCCKLVSKDQHQDTTMWGLSVYKGRPGFRTMGREVNTWMAEMKDKYRWSMFEFYDNHEEALDRIRLFTCPVYQTLAHG